MLRTDYLSHVFYTLFGLSKPMTLVLEVRWSSFRPPSYLFINHLYENCRKAKFKIPVMTS